MTQALGALADRVAGSVIRPDDEAYEEARRVYNAMIDVRPAAIVRCATEDDVVAVVRLAAENGHGPRRPRRWTQRARLRHRRRRDRRRPVRPAVGRRSTTRRAHRGRRRRHHLGPVQRRHRSARPGHHRRDHLHHGHRRADPRRRHRLPLPGARPVLRQPAVGPRGHRRRRAASPPTRTRTPTCSGRCAAAAATSASSPSSPTGCTRSTTILGGPMFFELSDGAGDLQVLPATASTTAPREFGGFPAFQIAPPLPFVPEDRAGEPFARSSPAGPAPGGGAAVPRRFPRRSPRRSPSISARCRTRRSTAPSTGCSRPACSTTGRPPTSAT